MVADEALIREAKPPERDAVAEVMRANLRRSLLGVDAPAPTRGRFTVLERLGGGAMGTVLAAYDPVLDRKVAIKVLRERGEAARARVLAEARALAQLSHPNVVAVHEADEHDDEVYIAMEFVRGVDLRAWMAEGPRPWPWPQVVPILTNAARGLAAAHTAGVIHCDFKPENVLVGEDGVRVVDFGLAHREREDHPSHTEAGSGGTPSYMAPERLDGKPATAASDQFAFGVTLHEALYGRRPFEGAMTRAPQGGSTPQPIPRWLERLVARTLRLSADARFPSMDDVVAEMSQQRRHRRTMVAVGLFAVTTAGLGIGVAAFGDTPHDDPCDGGRAAAEAVWSDERAAAIHGALGGERVPFGASTAARVSEELDDYRERWATTHREICEATRVHGTQSDTTYDLRMRCLERGLGELSALMDAIEGADGKASAKAIEAVRALPAPSRCDATGSTAARYAVPDDAPTRAKVLALRPRLDRAWASLRTGRYADARAQCEPLLEEAEAIAFTPLTAEALYLHGAVLGRVGGLPEAEAALRRAMLVAAQTEDDRLVAEASTRLLRTMMFAHEPARVYEAADFVRAAIHRADGDVHEVDGIVGEAKLGAGDAQGAIEGLERALTSERRADRIAILMTTLGSAHLARGEHEIGLRLYADALERASNFYGEGHPSVGFFLQRLGRGQREAGRLDDARRTLTNALELRRAALGDEDRAVASTLVDLGMTEMALGDPQTAVGRLHRALKIREAVYGPEHPRVAEVLLPLGDAQRDGGQREQALASYERARALREAATPEHPQLMVIRERIEQLEGRPLGSPSIVRGDP